MHSDGITPTTTGAKTGHGNHYVTGEPITVTYYRSTITGAWVLQVRPGHVPLEKLYDTSPDIILTGSSEEGIRREALRMLGRADGTA